MAGKRLRKDKRGRTIIYLWGLSAARVESISS
jgi:hypothetical protein